MAAINGQIVLTTCEGRPCWVNGRRAIFHRWTDSARPVKPTGADEESEARFQKYSVHGLVEYEDGTMEREWPNVIQFADSSRYFAGYDWDTMEAERDARAWGTEETAQEPEPEPWSEPNEGGVFIVETKSHCDGCAHEHDNEEFCQAAGYNCPECNVIGCVCRRCNGGDRREEKGGAATW